MRKKHTKGFTLFEALIAISLGVSLLIVVLSIYTLSIKSLNSSESRSEIVQNGRTILERLTRDIRQARDITTYLPPDDTDPLNPPSNELMMQDGHNTELFQYIRYYLTSTDLYRQVVQYSFADEPSVLVSYDAEDEFGNPPDQAIITDQLVGQYVEDVQYYGVDMITVLLTLQKGGVTHTTTTMIFGRNL